MEGETWSGLNPGPAEIRAHLPLAWALGALYGVEVVGSELTNCPFPEHDDETPSFGLYPVGVLDHFKCQGGSCGAQGSVIDLIARARDVEFVEAVEIARDELLPEFEKSGWKPARPLSERPPGKSPEELARIVERLSEARDDVLLGQFAREKAKDARRLEFASTEFVAYAAEEFEWCGFDSRVVMPHRSPSGAVTGIRYRIPGRRWAEPGSRFPYPYGVWRSRRAEAALLLEGETDTAFAAYSLRERTDLDVFGVTSASARPAGIDSLAKRRTVYLAFDADDAGERATRAYSEALANATRVLVVELPDGEDVLSCGIPVRDLLERASG